MQTGNVWFQSPSRLLRCLIASSDVLIFLKDQVTRRNYVILDDNLRPQHEQVWDSWGWTVASEETPATLKL